DFSGIFHKVEAPAGVATHHSERQNHPIEDVLDRKLIVLAREALEQGTPVAIESTIANIDRAAGAMLSGEVARRYGHTGLADDTIKVSLTGTAGQSFAAWLAAGVALTLSREAHHHVRQGLSRPRRL